MISSFATLTSLKSEEIHLPKKNLTIHNNSEHITLMEGEIGPSWLEGDTRKVNELGTVKLHLNGVI